MDGADGVRGSLKRRWFAGFATYAPTVMRRTAPLALVASMVLALVGPTGVGEANDAGTNIANFAESRGCDPHIGGTPRPNVGVTGAMPIGTQIRGPWGDTFGRTYYQVEQSLVSWRLPGSWPRWPCSSATSRVPTPTSSAGWNRCSVTCSR